MPASHDDLAPSGAKARFLANVAAIETARAITTEQRPATAEEQQVLARWSSWGALPDVFDDSKQGWADERDWLRELLAPEEWDAAARTTINAHYTDPLIIRQMWRALTVLGFDGGQVLEPGSGLGTLIGMAPATARMTGVELDPVTATISRALYPHAEVRGESFADTRLPEGMFDAAIGNVPFSNVTLHDPVHNPTRQSMHNHFILKSLRLVRPGGMVAVLTSQYTMDAQNPGARREMGLLADLVGAIRVPAGAHRRTAGTDVVTDLLILRRHADDTRPADDGLWETVTPISLDGQTAKINAYFDAHPEHVLGTLGIGHGMYGPALTVTGDLERLETDLADAIDQITFTARRTGMTFTAPTVEHQARRAAHVPSPPNLWDGSIVATERGFGTVAAGAVEPLPVPKSAETELRALLRLRDAATRLLEMEAATVDDTEEITTQREGLRRDYQKYLGRYGPLNRYTLRRTGRTNAAGEETHARVVPTPIRLLRSDPFGALVLALEQFDDTEQTATPAALMTRRVVAPRTEVQGVDTPADAVAVSLDRTGRIELPLIADMLGMDEDEARGALTGLVFTDPVTDELIHAPAYLSGDVRTKLDAAAERAADPAFQANVDALSEVVPEPLGVQEIAPRMGAVWISADVHAQFLNELLRTSEVRVENPLPGMWEVRGGRAGLLATSEWGTERRPAPDIAQAVMEQKTLLVYDEIEDVGGKTRRVLNPLETTAAQEKADAIQERFAEWVFEDPERARTLVAEYNKRFNSIVLRDYTGAGEYLTLPGMAENFVPRPHQRSAVARMIAEPAAGLFHEVGAGKTAEMIMGVMEMRRMGLISKPVLVIPNHMLEQFSREWLQIYPQARILAASSKDLTADKRRLFVARASASEWDGVLLTQGAFEKIPLRQETQQTYIQAQVDEMRQVLADAEGDKQMSVKRIQRRLLQLENKVKARIDSSRDAGVCFEDTGIDYVVVDEMHMYKNLATESNIQDAAIEGSNRASDLHMKLEYLRSQGRERVVTGATATPISNSVTEAFVMQKYLRPDLLEAAGIGAFDAWAATFGQTVTQMEMAPTANNTFRMKTRFAKFQNVPEMLKLWSIFADVKTAEDLQLPVPDLSEREDGRRAPATVAIQPTVELEQFIETLGARAEKVAARQVSPSEDNMLTISTDGRKAALDIRMIVPRDPSGPTKVDLAADSIHQVWERTKDNTYLDPVTGQESAVRGALQLVFSDIGTPHADRWNAYDELRAQLAARGMPAESIRYMHEAKTDVDKARLFAAARAGHVAVLMGSTEKMGVGTNVQNRAVALYHLDCPWRPSDIAQREGRILRQGNQNPEVGIVRFVTERSFDSYMWQGVERKAMFIAQLMRGRLDTREIEEIDSSALSAAEAKAISSGNPLLLEHSTVHTEVQRLRRLERAYHRNESMLAHARDRAGDDVRRASADIEALEAVLPQVTDTSGENFRIELHGRTYTSRADAAHALAAWAYDSDLKWAPRYASRDYGTIGRVSGFEITVSTSPALGGDPMVHVQLDGVPRSGFVITRGSFLDGGVGLIQRIENRASGIPSLLEQARTDHARAEAERTDAEQRIGQPFRHAPALADAEEDLARIETQLAAMQEDIDHESRPEPAPEPEREPALTVEAVRAHRPALGIRPDPQRSPATTAAFTSTDSAARDLRPRRL
ncbi:lactate dehydrogenase [Brooklawnia propionicigenes]|uniref:Lactate dehydrogenase n=1 Tax=Brooklawnia propionicigenes TaxID=3041175 RepID=A0AAN0K6I6_9ACTN|nr:helicase [Brooklawnia sp. SH051]BEH01862.1 lactate dehydrogenase [Brooklawnia sp. SH051]